MCIKTLLFTVVFFWNINIVTTHTVKTPSFTNRQMSEVNNKDQEALPDAISEQQLLAKYDFYLKMLEKFQQVKTDEDNFMTAFRSIAAVRGITFSDLIQNDPVTLQKLIFK